MKKIFVFLSVLFVSVCAKAVSLFPFFVDLVGNYKDGPVTELQPYKVECLYSNKCNCFYSIEAAESYLKDVLPFENYPIVKKKGEIEGLNIEVYASLLEDDRSSVLCLIEVPEKGLYVIYDELPGNPFQVKK